MAYYAALVSTVKFLKEIINPIPGHPYPVYIFQKHQITCLYETLWHLQELLEDYSPKDREADGFLERIREVACRVEYIIERQTLDTVPRQPLMPDAVYRAKCVIESRISDRIREPNCLAEIIRAALFSIFVSRRNSLPDVVETMKKRYINLLKLARALECFLKIGYQNLEKSKNEVDSIMGEGYLDMVKSKEEIDSIAIKGYQDLVKLNEELDAFLSKGHQDSEWVEEVADSIVRRGCQEVQRVNEEVDSVLGKGYYYLLDKLKKEVDPIVEELTMRIKDSHTTHQEDLQVTIDEPSDDGTTMVGFEQHLTTLKAQLFGDSSKLEVLSIVGMGGIGKTTLARHIFYDERICNHFDFCVWVTISQSYHLRKILLSIANSLNINNGELDEVDDDVLKDHIRRHLFGWRYLIIMDDVWDTKILEDVKWIFPDDNKSRSRIMITTRQLNVASIASESDFINQIPFLGYNQSWDLFCEKVFFPPELEDIGRSIVKNCGGLPLAIAVVAGLLSKTSKTWDHWGDIARRVSSIAAENDEYFSKILSLSYDHLPHHLKPCFLYLGGFPEDYEISISRLVKLWVAEGFLKPVASKCLEEAAEEYLEELVKRNLVLIAKRRSNGKFKSCIMHDLLRDLCLERARHEHFLLLPHKHNVADHHTHRFFIHPNFSSSDIDMLKNNVRHVRSIVSFDKREGDFLSHLSSCKPLRVMDAPDAHFSFLDDGVLELLNLRFLELDNPKFNIPSSISQLQHLQTLIAQAWFSELSLPAEFWVMPQLRHVRIQNLKLPSSSDGGSMSDRLPFLQTLSTLVDCTFTSGIVEMVPSIKKLKLKYTQKYDRCDNAWTVFGLRNLINLHQLETLAVQISFAGMYLEVPFPESFAFPSNLGKLTLVGCRLPWENMTIVGTLPHLQILKLRWDAFVGVRRRRIPQAEVP